MRVFIEGEGYVQSMLANGWWWIVTLFGTVFGWTCIAAVCIVLAGCGLTPNQRPEEFRVPIKSYLTVDVSQKVCSATDGKTTLVWGCR
jgi:hypothetical protein